MSLKLVCLVYKVLLLLLLVIIITLRKFDGLFLLSKCDISAGVHDDTRWSLSQPYMKTYSVDHQSSYRNTLVREVTADTFRI